MSHAGTEDKFIKTLFPQNMEGLKVLDVGHGYGATGLYIRTRTYKNGWCELTGLEPFEEYHDLMKKIGIYDKVVLGKGENLPFDDKYFDVSIAQHVIEHLTRKNAYQMLKEMERVTKNRVIVCTPNGFTESGPLDDNVFNNHVSGWRDIDFKRVEYKTKIITKNVNSRLLILFAKTLFALKRKQWENEVLVAWKDLN